MGALDLWRSISRDARVAPRPDDVTGLWWQQPQNQLSQIVIDDIFGEMLEVVDPGDHPSILRGDHLQKPVVDEINRTVLRNHRQIQTRPVLKAVESVTAMKQPDWMARLQSGYAMQEQHTNHASSDADLAASGGETTYF